MLSYIGLQFMVRIILYDMSKRGLILRFKESEEVAYYFLAPWMVGIWEFQVNNLNQENIELYEKYFQEGIVPLNKKKKVGGFRVIPIEQEIQSSIEIQPYEKVSEIIESHTRFAVAVLSPHSAWHESVRADLQAAPPLPVPAQVLWCA